MTAETKRKTPGVEKRVTTDLERTVNGILCAANPRCKLCNFRCAKWFGDNYNAEKNVKIIQEILTKFMDKYGMEGQ